MKKGIRRRRIRENKIITINSASKIIEKMRSKSKGRRFINQKSFQLPKKKYPNALDRVEEIRAKMALTRPKESKKKKKGLIGKLTGKKLIKGERLAPIRLKGVENGLRERYLNFKGSDLNKFPYMSDRSVPMKKEVLPSLKAKRNEHRLQKSYTMKKKKRKNYSNFDAREKIMICEGKLDQGEVVNESRKHRKSTSFNIEKEPSARFVKSEKEVVEKKIHHIFEEKIVEEDDLFKEEEMGKEKKFEEKKLKNLPIKVNKKKKEKPKIKSKNKIDYTNYSKDIQSKLKEFLYTLNTERSIDNDETNEEIEANFCEEENTPSNTSLSENLEKIPIFEKSEKKLKLNWFGKKFEPLSKNIKIIKPIGQGSFAKVYKAFDKKLKKEVAVKVFIKKKLFSKFKRDLLQREINFLRKLDHQNIPKLHRIVETKQKVYFLMEFWGEETLKQFIEKKKTRLDKKEVKKIMKQLIEVMDYVHSEGIYHRDIKLGNLLYNEGKIGLIDFGLATDSKYGKEYLQCGTMAYMPPELLQKKAYNAWSVDIWSIGVVFYWLLKRKAPFVVEGMSEAEVKEKILKIKVNFKGVGDDELEVLKMIFRRKPDERINIYQLNSLRYWNDV